jgi:orotate phosphoribosyltransferase
LPTTVSIDALHVHQGDPRVVEELLHFPDAMLMGHFELLSGLHTDRFLAFSRIAADPTALGFIADWLQPCVAAQRPTTLVAPSTAGVGLGWALAQRLGVPLHLASLGATGRADGLLGDPRLDEERVLLVNDLVTTGQGLKALGDVVVRCGGTVRGATWFLTRGEADVEDLIGAPCFAVATLPLEAWDAELCPLCREHEPAQLALDLN